MLTLPRFVFRNLVYHGRSNFAVLLGVAVGSAVLTGSLLVGDSLRGSLRIKAERQLNGVTSAYIGAKLVRSKLAAELPGSVAPVFLLQGSAQAGGERPEGELNRIGQASILGIDERFPLAGVDKTAVDWAGEKRVAVVGHRVAERLGLKVGADIELGVEQMSNVPRSSLLGRRDTNNVTKALRLTVAAILPPDNPANDFSLIPSPGSALNVFLPLKTLEKAVNQPGRANALLAFGEPGDELNAALRQKLTLDDWGLTLKEAAKRNDYINIESRQLVLDPATVEAVERAAKALGLRSERTIVYLANWIMHGRQVIPYSIVAALDPSAPPPLGPFLPPGSKPLADDEILLAKWDESPIVNAKPGDAILLMFFKPEMEAGPREETVQFRFRATIPIAGAADDPDLTPPFPGVTDKATIGDWDPPFPYDNKRIRPRDEHYWDKYRTTPKAYITLAAGERLFHSRFGSITSVRIAPAPGETPNQTISRLGPAILKELNPEAGGLAFEPVRDRLLHASKGGTDFGMLFLGFSCFLIAASLLLVGLLFRLSLDRRAKEIGLLLAAGYSVKQVRRLLLAEGLALAAVGSALGLGAGLGFNAALLQLLTALWPDPEVATFLRPHETALSFGLGFGLTMGMATFAIFLSCRGLVRVPPPALLRGETLLPETHTIRTQRSLYGVIAIGSATVLGLVLIAAGGSLPNPDFQAMSFFMGGGLLLLAALAVMWVWMKRARHAVVDGRGPAALVRLGARNAARNPLRSLLTASLLASAAFLLVAVESFRRQPQKDFLDIKGGSGGFNLVAESAVPLFQKFDVGDGRAELETQLQSAYGGSSTDPRFKAALDTLKEIDPQPGQPPNVFYLHLHGGDDASCLNLYQAARPRLLGLPEDLIARGGFLYADSEAETTEERANPWLLLNKPTATGAVPVIVEQNTAMWMLKTGVGGEIDLPDETGRNVKLRIVGTLIDSPFQSELLMAEAPFQKLFPHSEGYRAFLIRTPPGRERAVASVLDLGLANYGFTATPMRERIASYQAVIGAYLSTFQVLGGLGLLLGVFGLAVVILRGVWERLAELALLRAFGYRLRALELLVLAENALLLALGLGAGVAAALISVAPHIGGTTVLLWARLAAMLGAVLILALLVALAATAGVLRVPLIPALRRE